VNPNESDLPTTTMKGGGSNGNRPWQVLRENTHATEITDVVDSRRLQVRMRETSYKPNPSELKSLIDLLEGLMWRAEATHQIYSSEVYTGAANLLPPKNMKE